MEGKKKVLKKEPKSLPVVNVLEPSPEQSVPILWVCWYLIYEHQKQPCTVACLELDARVRQTELVFLSEAIKNLLVQCQISQILNQFRIILLLL